METIIIDSESDEEDKVISQKSDGVNKNDKSYDSQTFDTFDDIEDMHFREDVDLPAIKVYNDLFYFINFKLF